LSFSLCIFCPTPISSSVIYSCQQYWMESTYHEVSHKTAVFFIHLITSFHRSKCVSC
jgi:hypothetical protein